MSPPDLTRCLEILGAASGATQADLRTVYLRRIAEYHPDKVAALGPDLRALAEEKTKQINEAYRIVSAVVAASGRVPRPAPATSAGPPVPPPPRPSSQPVHNDGSIGRAFLDLLLGLMRRAPLIPVALVAWCGIEVFGSDPEPRSPGLPVTTPTAPLSYTPKDTPPREDFVLAAPPQPPKRAWVRPPNAPNGAQWPTESGYVSGYERLHAGGLSSLTIDNTQNDADVFLKLVSLASADPLAVRVVFVRARETLRIRSIDKGSYDIRYRDLDSGVISKSDPFEVQQIEEPDGVRYSNMTITLYKVSNGNFRTEEIPESEF